MMASFSVQRSGTTEHGGSALAVVGNDHSYGRGSPGQHIEPDCAPAAARDDLPAGRGQDDLSKQG